MTNKSNLGPARPVDHYRRTQCVIVCFLFVMVSAWSIRKATQYYIISGCTEWDASHCVLKEVRVESCCLFLLLFSQLRLTHTSLQLVLQHCSGGTLEAYCRQHKVTEDLACYFLHQLVAVLEHLHSSMIAYRDLKLQNVLLRSKPSRKSPPRLVVCDLGTAKTLTGHAFKCETFVGTPGEHANHRWCSRQGCYDSWQCCWVLVQVISPADSLR